MSVASHAITAVYGGDGNFNTSTSGTVNQVVNKANTTTGLTSSINPTVFGQSTTLTATVTAVAPGVGTPSGTVDFKDGATVIAAAVPLNGSAVATFSTSSLSVGGHSITAVYSGNGNFLTSTSSAVNQVVNKANTTTGLTSSINPTVFGQSTTLTATVTAVAPGVGTPERHGHLQGRGDHDRDRNAQRIRSRDILDERPVGRESSDNRGLRR